jgi:hypothetical protein
MQVLESSLALNYTYLQLAQQIIVVVLATHWLGCLALLATNLEATYTNNLAEPMIDATGFSGYVAATYWCAIWFGVLRRRNCSTPLNCEFIIISPMVMK